MILIARKFNLIQGKKEIMPFIPFSVLAFINRLFKVVRYDMKSGRFTNFNVQFNYNLLLGIFHFTHNNNIFKSFYSLLKLVMSTILNIFHFPLFKVLWYQPSRVIRYQSSYWRTVMVLFKPKLAGNKGAHAFPEDISPKVNVIVWLELEFQLGYYYDDTVQHFNH